MGRHQCTPYWRTSKACSKGDRVALQANQLSDIGAAWLLGCNADHDILRAAITAQQNLHHVENFRGAGRQEMLTS